MTNAMNRTLTTGNVYIRDGGRGGGGGRVVSLSLPGRWEDYGGGVRVSNYGNSGINIRRKIVLRVGTRGGGVTTTAPPPPYTWSTRFYLPMGGKGVTLWYWW